MEKYCCPHCKKELDKVLINEFDCWGGDKYHPSAIKYCEPQEMENGCLSEMCIEVETNDNWVGFDLTDAEQKETILCPYCNKSLNISEIQVFHVVKLIAFVNKE